MEKIKNQSLLRNCGFVGGKWQTSCTKHFAVDNPATAQAIAQVADMGAGETKQAINAAYDAWANWRNKSGKERGAVLLAWYEHIMQNADDLAKLMTLEQGKPLAESRGEVIYGASFVQWFAEEAKRGGGEIIPPVRANTQIRVTRESAGVAAMITPWNFPIAMITRKAAPALAAGCPVVIKPAAETPLCAIALAALAEESGMPAGVFNLITSNDAAAVGKEMCDNEKVRVLSFTGSTEVGKILFAQCAGTIKKLALELGGNAPFIVFDDADIPRAVAQAIVCKFRNAGQTCVCANRIYVQEKVYDDFCEQFAAAIAKFKVGDGLQDGVTIGPLITDDACEKAAAHVADCKQHGAEVVLGGGAHEFEGANGLSKRFFTPTLLRDVSDQCLPCREETFAPIAPLFKFRDEDEVVHRANATIYGLSAYFCTQDLSRAMRVSSALEAGIIGVNEGIISSEVAPFGGVKQSGVGREGGSHGMDEYTEIKYTLLGY